MRKQQTHAHTNWHDGTLNIHGVRVNEISQNYSSKNSSSSNGDGDIIKFISIVRTWRRRQRQYTHSPCIFPIIVSTPGPSAQPILLRARVCFCRFGIIISVSELRVARRVFFFRLFCACMFWFIHPSIYPIPRNLRKANCNKNTRTHNLKVDDAVQLWWNAWTRGQRKQYNDNNDNRSSIIIANTDSVRKANK